MSTMAEMDSPPVRNAPNINVEKAMAALGLIFVVAAVAIWGAPADGAWALGVGVVVLTLVLISRAHPQRSAPQGGDRATPHQPPVDT